MEGIDICIDYIESEQAKYICKDDRVMIYKSITGRKIDRLWQSYTLQQINRIISYTIAPVEDTDIIAAFQELDLIYTETTRSTTKTPKGVLNIGAKVSELDQCTERLLEALRYNNIKIVVMGDLRQIYKIICRHINKDFKTFQVFIPKTCKLYMADHGYVWKSGSKRILNKDTKLKSTGLLDIQAPATYTKTMKPETIKYLASIAINGD